MAVRRAVLTGVGQINQRYLERSMEALETDLVEVSAHRGARDVDGPKGWENHKAWQGKVYRWDIDLKTLRKAMESPGRSQQADQAPGGGLPLTESEGRGTVQSSESPEPDIQIGRSLGAKAFQDPVRLPNGKTAIIAEGTKITKVYTFAGPKAKNPVRVAKQLAKNYHVDADRWTHKRGDGYVDEGGRIRHAELHWFEHPDVGRVKMKVKRYFDDES